MRKVVSVSLGSSKRDKSIKTTLFGLEIVIQRIGTDGSIQKAIEIIKELDGQVDAFGLGGTDLYIYLGEERYILHSSKKIVQAAKITPVFDGSIMKSILETKTIQFLTKNHVIDFNGLQTLVVCGSDRYGISKALENSGARVTYGDCMFILGLPIKINSFEKLGKVGKIIAPIVTRLPISWLYPIGKSQEVNKPGRYSYLFTQNDLIVGDFHLIYKNMPEDLYGKTIITNTVTNENIDSFRERGVSLLVTTTPNFEGRSFGTNVVEAMLASILKKVPSIGEFENLIKREEFKPRIERLNY